MVKEQKKEKEEVKRVTRKRSNSDVMKDYTSPRSKRKGPTSYQVYAKEERPKMKEANPNSDSKEITVKIKEQWDKFTQDEKDRYKIAVGASS